MSLMKILQFFAGARLLFFVILWLMVLLVAGTVAQKDMGLFAAQQKYFSSVIWWVGGALPMPGGGLTMGFMAVCLLLKILLQHWTLKSIGSLVAHLGVLTLLAGGFFSAFFAVEGMMRIEEGATKNYMVDVEAGIMPPPKIALPFTLKLLDFKMTLYPGTNMAASYASDVIVVDGELEWPAYIAMNQPLRYKGYTFYQSSFEETPEGDATVLAVVKNPGRLFPYLASTLLCVGLLMHAFQRLPVLMRRRQGR